MNEYSFTIDQILSNSLTQSDYDEINSIYRSSSSSYGYIASLYNKYVSRLNKLELFIESATVEAEEISNLLSTYNVVQSYLTNIDSNKLLAHSENFVNMSYNNLSHNYTGFNTSVILLSKLNSIRLNIIKSKDLLYDLQSLIIAEKKALCWEASMLKAYKNIAESAKNSINKGLERLGY